MYVCITVICLDDQRSWKVIVLQVTLIIKIFSRHEYEMKLKCPQSNKLVINTLCGYIVLKNRNF